MKLRHEFAILPWEYHGSDFDPAPHAVASLEVGGRKRKFLLKMRAGIVFFRETKRPLVFAIARPLERELRGEELVSVWRAEMERGNFGRVYWRPTSFLDCMANTIVVSIMRSDYSGYISDAFHIDWLKIPKHRDGRTLDLDKTNVGIGKVTYRAIKYARATLLDREMPAGERQSIAPHWFLGNQAELERVVGLITRLYIRCGEESRKRRWYFEATNPASSGGVRGYFSMLDQSYQRELHVSPFLRPLLKVVDQHFVWVAMEWDSPRNIQPWNATSEKWGANWRGNYFFSTPQLELSVPLVDSLSGHERLELSFELRDWLQGKASTSQIDKWLSHILD